MWVRRNRRPIPRQKSIEEDVHETACGREQWRHSLTREQEQNCEGNKSHERRRALDLPGQATEFRTIAGSGTSREESRDA
jgi:hypothetical protein